MTRPVGPLLGLDPLQFSVGLFVLLVLFVFYLLLPRAVRKQYFGAYPRRHAWSARLKRYGSNSVDGSASYPTQPSNGGTGSMGGTTMSGSTPRYGGYPPQQQQQQQMQVPQTQMLPPRQNVPRGGGAAAGMYGDEEEQVVFGNAAPASNQEEIVISAAMQQLRDPGVLIVAHGSRGKPKTVRLQLTESAVTWRTETRKSTGGPPKLGKLHQVPLHHIMYVDVGKQTTALRRVENAGVPESLCFSLLTKEGSLDLEANAPRERDALVSCFSLVLDEVHAQNWRDLYRGPSSEMPSSFDEMDPRQMQGPQAGGMR